MSELSSPVPQGGNNEAHANEIQSIIVKALSGFYYVRAGEETIVCRARGKFRHLNITPLVGDQVLVLRQLDGSGVLTQILPRRNEFQRPAVSNIDQMVMIASGTTPVTAPFLIDRVLSIAQDRDCEPVVCINKWDLAPEESLYRIYSEAGFQTIPVSAKTGFGVEELRSCLKGKVSAFTGNSGVGKTSLLNALDPSYQLRIGQVSEKLGRGRHTTRHIEIFELPEGGLIADTPGYSAFDAEKMALCEASQLARTFREFIPYLGQCRFLDCAHVKETDCAVLQAVQEEKIAESRHSSYVRLYEQAKERKAWK